MIDISDRLRMLADGHEPMELVRKTGMAYSSAKKYFEGGTPSVESVARIADAYGITLDWLLTGQGPMRRSHVFDLPVASELTVEFCLVNRLSVDGSAGPGAAVEEERVIDRMAFRRDWLQQQMRLDPERLAVISVVGDSMEPALRDGELILIDLREGRRLAHDAIYAIQHDGELRLKRVTKLVSGDLILRSDNQQYPAETIRADLAEAVRLKVIGRVVWAGRRM